MADEPVQESAPAPDEDAPTASEDGPTVNQGATGERPDGEHAVRASDPGPGETPLSVESEGDPFADRPEAFVGAAFAGGFALAMILRRFAR
jgi:hypothetical protein